MSNNFFQGFTQILHKNLVKNVCFCQQNWVTKTLWRLKLFSYVNSTPYDIYKKSFRSCILHCKCCFLHSRKTLSVPDRDRVSSGQMNFFLNAVYKIYWKQSVPTNSSEARWLVYINPTNSKQLWNMFSFAVISIMPLNFLAW